MPKIRDFLNSIEREIANKINMSKIRDFLNKIKGHEKIRPSVRPSARPSQLSILGVQDSILGPWKSILATKNIFQALLVTFLPLEVNLMHLYSILNLEESIFAFGSHFSPLEFNFRLLGVEFGPLGVNFFLQRSSLGFWE